MMVTTVLMTIITLFFTLLVFQASDASSEKLFNTVIVNKGKTLILSRGLLRIFIFVSLSLPGKKEEKETVFFAFWNYGSYFVVLLETESVFFCDTLKTVYFREYIESLFKSI